MTGDPERLSAALDDLSRRGLVQFDRMAGVYDVHPVVRGMVAARMDSHRREVVGSPVVDYFNAKASEWPQDVRTLEDLTIFITLLRVLFAMGRFDAAFDTYKGDFSEALLLNLDADAECQALLKPFFPDGWHAPPVLAAPAARSYLYNDAAIAFLLDDPALSEYLYERAIEADLASGDELELGRKILNLASHFCGLGRLALADRLHALAGDLAVASASPERLFRTTLSRYWMAVKTGREDEADRLWNELRAMGLEWTNEAYRAGDAEYFHALDMMRRGRLDDSLLKSAEALAVRGRNRVAIEALHLLRGRWHLSANQPEPARASFDEAVRMAREAGRLDTPAEAWLILARLRAGQEFEAAAAAEQLAAEAESVAEAALPIAEIWEHLGDFQRAVDLARAAFHSAAADGEPFVARAELDHARALLLRLDVAPPQVGTHDVSGEAPFPWEAEARALASRLSAARRRS